MASYSLPATGLAQPDTDPARLAMVPDVIGQAVIVGALGGARLPLRTAHRDPTAWLGMSDSNSGIRARPMYLRNRDNPLGSGGLGH